MEQSVDAVWIKQNSSEYMYYEEPGNTEVLCVESVLEGNFCNEVFDVEAFLKETYDRRSTEPQINELNHSSHSLASDSHYDVIDDDKIYSLENEQPSSGPKDPTSHGSPGSFLQNSRDSTEVHITHELSQCMEYEEMVDIFQPLIIKNLIVREILPYLPFIEDHDDIYAAEKRSKSEAVISLLNELKSCKEVGKWHKFIEALSACGYEYIVQNIRGYKFINHRYQEQYIKTLAPKLSKMLQPIVLLPRLYKEDVISDNDREEIEMENRNHGNIASANLLLIRISKKHSKWYTKFIKVLRKEGYDEIAEVLDIPHLTEVIKTKFNSNDNRMPPPPPPLSTLPLKFNVLTDSSISKLNEEVYKRTKENVNEVKTLSREIPFPLENDYSVDDCNHSDIYRAENMTDEQEILYVRGENSDPSIFSPECFDCFPSDKSESKDGLNGKLSETINQYNDENYSSKFAPPLPPKGIPPKPQNHSKLFFGIPAVASLPRQDMYQVFESDLPLNTNLLQNTYMKEVWQGCDMSSKDEHFQILGTELSDLENEAANLDKEIKHLEKKNVLKSDINIKLRQRRNLLRDIDKKEREAEALKGPLNASEADQTYLYGYLDSANALIMTNSDRHGGLHRKRTMTFHNISDNMFGESAVKIYDPTAFNEKLKSKLSDCDSAIYCRY